MFNNNNLNPQKNKIATLTILKILSGCIAVLAFIKLLNKDSNGFTNDLITSLLIFMTTVCLNGLLSGFLVISLLFTIIQTSIFFLLQIQNFILNITSGIDKNNLINLYIINSLSLILYSLSVYFCYKFYGETNVMGFSQQNNRFNDNSPNLLEQNQVENQRQNPNFRAFEGRGVRLDN